MSLESGNVFEALPQNLIEVPEGLNFDRSKSCRHL